MLQHKCWIWILTDRIDLSWLMFQTQNLQTIYAKIILGSKPHHRPKLAGQEAEASGSKSPE